MFCPNCGKEQAGTPTFCYNCGFRLVPESVLQPETNVPLPVLPVKYAGFWRRLAAFVLDFILIIIANWVIIFITSTIIYLFTTQIDPATWDNIVGTTIFLAFPGIYWLYYALMESSSRQATLGKMAVGSIVTESEGRKISFGRATGRQFAKLISLLVPLGIGFLMISFSAKKQGLHDMIADTLVVQK